jgi:putative oxidoreductase
MWTLNGNQKLILVGRILLSTIFILSGVSKALDWDSTVQAMTGAGVPFASILIVLAILIEVLGGLSILLGFKARVGATALLVYLVPVTLTFHGFWMFTGMERQMQMVNFLKNLAIMGGLFEVLATGAGLLSVDYRMSRNKQSQIPAGRDRIRAVS